MRGTELAVWICLALIVFHHIGYPLMLFIFSALSQAKSDFIYLIRRANRRCSPQTDYVPRVAVLMSLYNEEAVIRVKVRNLLETNYPFDRLEFLLGLDAAVDSTGKLLSQIPSSRLRVFPFQTRRGKLAVLCDLAGHTSAEILVLTDANTMLEKNCIRNLVRHFADPRVGAVSGEEIRVVTPGTDPGAESLYWRYESALKILESRLDCSLGGNGAALAVRRSLFHPRKRSIVEDFQIPLEIGSSGYRVVYDPEAVATEDLAPTLSAQFERRARMGAGSFQTLFGNPQFLNPLRGLPTLVYLSHKVLRWVTPFLLLAVFFCNIWLASRVFYAGLLLAQSLFYLTVAIGYWRKRRGRPTGLCSLPFYFCAMNLPLVVGLFRYLGGRQKRAWKVTPRQMPIEMLSREGS